MKCVGLFTGWVVCVGFGLAALTGCGGSSSGGGGGTPPSITSFTASPATIGVGQSSSLTATFSGGTGVITPGNISVNSGTAVSVSPTTTTAYTLTVTPASGSPVTQTVTVTVVPPAAITSFAASPVTIGAGQSSSLIAVFSGGTGVITPGNISVTSGTAISVSPTTTTTYTLTVTPTVGMPATQTVTVTVVPPPSITSFTASPATIGAGQSSSLTAVFSGGTAVITPGNISVTSGTAVSVSPTTTTTYTLTVTPTVGTPATLTATVTVVPPPSITSFTADPATITSGQSSSLTAVFSGGTAVITPGNISATSGTAVSVSPTTTTTYTLTVTPTIGTAATQTVTVTIAAAAVTVDQTSTGVAVTNQILGMNMAVWYDFTANTSTLVNAFQNAGIVALRWPGGSTSDDYHWNGTSTTNPANGVAPTPSTCEGAYQDPNTNYLNFINDLESAITNGFDVALTADYGTNPSCNGGGEPSEAANWVQYAYANGGKVSHVTVGNEVYGHWEEDMHAVQWDPTTYYSAVIGTNGYYDLIKAANASTLVGVVVDANCTTANDCTDNWDTTVLPNAAGYYDFVEYHYYPQNPGSENDTYLVQQAAQGLTTNINKIKTELTNAGEPNTPIYVGEMGSVSSNPGKQSMSITQGLYAGQMLGEMMNDGVSRATWWIGFGNCNGSSGYMGTTSNPIYGWQDFGAYNVFSDGSEDASCTPWGTLGSVSPTSVAFQLFSNVAVTGENVLTPTVTGDTTDVRAYAATHSGGTALVLFNLNETTSETLTIGLSSESSSSDVQQIYYDKALYDETDSTYNNGNPAWVGPTTTDLGSQSFPMTITLTPWSMNVLIIK
jgi:alpha-L-arabinofuranosidase